MRIILTKEKKDKPFGPSNVQIWNADTKQLVPDIMEIELHLTPEGFTAKMMVLVTDIEFAGDCDLPTETTYMVENEDKSS